mmetsp:Transcript_11096/g.17114  ORF Transcript_11096/g.17114 Transcript_11096/m.17114 type:complete len:205 (-) Transcript_11096:457-1071(-)
MMRLSVYLFPLLFLQYSSVILGWQQPLQKERVSFSTTTAGEQQQPSKMTLLPRRSFLLPVASAAFLTSITTSSSVAQAAVSTFDAANDQWKQSVNVIDKMLNNWESYKTGDSIRVELGTQGTSSPLFQIDKAFKVLRDDAEDIIEFTETSDEFLLTLARADSMAYSANFAGGSGKPTPPEVYIEKAKKEVVDLQKIAKALSALL